MLGFFLFFLAYLVDFSDGSIARLKGLSSLVGAFLDPSLDQVRNQFLFFLLAYRAWSLQGDVSFLYLYIGFFIIATITHALDVQKNILLLRATHQYESVERFFGIKSGSFYSILVNIYESTHSIFLLVLASFLFMIPFSEYFFVKLFFVAYASSYLFKLCFISFVALKQFARMDAKAK